MKVLEAESMSDAGVFYSSENYILPNNRGGIAEHIIFSSDTAEMVEKGNDYVVKNQKYKLQLFKWTGTKLERVSKF